MLPYVTKVEARRQDLEEPEASGLQELVATIRSTTDVEYSFCDDNLVMLAILSEIVLEDKDVHTVYF